MQGPSSPSDPEFPQLSDRRTDTVIHNTMKKIRISFVMLTALKDNIQKMK